MLPMFKHVTQESSAHKVEQVNANFIATRQNLEQLLKDKNKIVSSMANTIHELRNLLTPIHGGLVLINDEIAEISQKFSNHFSIQISEILAQFAFMEQATNEMLELINNHLNRTKLAEKMASLKTAEKTLESFDGLKEPVQLEKAAVQAKQLIDQLEQEKKAGIELATSVYHKLGEWLATILGSASLIASAITSIKDSLLIKQGGLFDEIIEQVDLIKSSSKKMSSFLTGKNLQAEDTVLNSKVFDICLKVHSIVKSQLLAIVQKNLKLNMELPQHPIWVKGDNKRLKEIVTNLLNNAVKFTNTGSITISLKVEALPDNKIFIKITIQDTGVGIKAEEQAKLFQPLSQASNQTNGVYHGTGLGLANARQSSRLLGGDITFVSEFGAGTTFCLTVLFQTPSPEEIQQLKVIAKAPIDATPASPKTVAMVLASPKLAPVSATVISQLAKFSSIFTPPASPISNQQVNISITTTTAADSNFDKAPESPSKKLKANPG